MLIIEIVNTNEGTNENAHYRYVVRVNSEEIDRGSFDGHNRNDGWAELVRAISERHLTKRALDGANETLKVIGNATYCKNCGHWLWRESPRPNCNNATFKRMYEPGAVILATCWPRGEMTRGQWIIKMLPIIEEIKDDVSNM